MRILFSPIGGSDPINAGHDGSWLHCCRHYQPDLTDIYLSASMLTLEKKDQLYTRALGKLNEQLSCSIQMRVEERPSLENPQLLDEFYGDFEKLLTSLHQEFPQAEILVNISSGTPAMKSCLIHLYHMLTFPITMIQVDGPHDEITDGKGHRDIWGKDAIFDVEWENNLDNLEGAKNRCHVVRDEQQALRLRVMQLRSLIQHNEFYAAKVLADEPDLAAFLSEEVRKCLEAASERQQLSLRSAGLTFQQYGFSDARLLLSHYKDMMYKGAEMALTMQCDLARDDIAGFSRKLTPTLFSMLISYLKIKGVDAEQFTNNDINIIDESKLKTLYPSFYQTVWPQIQSYTGPTNLTHGNLLNMVQATPYDEKVLDRLRALRIIEKNVRNAVAHRPEKLTEKDFTVKAGKTPKAVLKDIQDLFGILNPSLFNAPYWESYNRMQSFLLEKL